MISYAIKIENDERQAGYFALISAGGITIVPDCRNAHRCETEDQAEECLQMLEERFGLNREEARIEMFADEKEFVLRIDGAGGDDAISVYEESGSRFLLVRNGIDELSHDLPNEVADALTNVLVKIDPLLKKARTE